MKDSCILMLDESAILRLLGDDPQLKINLKQAVLNHIAKRCITDVANIEVDKYMTNLNNFENLIKKEFQRLINIETSWSGTKTITMDAEFKRILKEQVESCFKDAMDQSIKTEVEKLNVMLKERIAILEKNCEKYLADAYGPKLTESRLDAALDRVIREKLAAK